MNKIEEYLSELPGGYRERALRAYKDHSTKPFKNIINTATAVGCTFIWAKTIEGYEFWDELHISLTKGTALPKLPKE